MPTWYTSNNGKPVLSTRVRFNLKYRHSTDKYDISQNNTPSKNYCSPGSTYWTVKIQDLSESFEIPRKGIPDKKISFTIKIYNYRDALFPMMLPQTMCSLLICFLDFINVNGPAPSFASWVCSVYFGDICRHVCGVVCGRVI
jgi:hypothetical protein